MSSGPRVPFAVRGIVASLAVALTVACGGSKSATPTSPTPTTPTLPTPRSLTVGTVGAGTGTITSADGTIQCGEFCEATYLTVVTVTLTAQPDPGFEFAGFEGDPDCADGVITLSASVSCVARFDVPRVLSVSLIGTGTGHVTSPDSTIDCGMTCSETFLITRSVTLVGVASPGSLFVGFGGDPDCEDGSVATSTDVTCTAQFEPTSSLAATSFLAFGDSITYGTVAVSSLGGFRLVGTPDSYPTQLESLLVAGYPYQTIAMDNQGYPGERSEEGVMRLPGTLAATTAEVMLLLHGANDLDAIGLGVGSIPESAANIDSMVQQAQAAGLTVILANLPPEDPILRDIAAPLVPQLNQAIATVAATRQVHLIDLYAGMDLSLIGPDGLHPTPLGYQRIADLFFGAITTLFDVPFAGDSGPSPTMTGSTSTRRDASGAAFRIGRRPLPAQLRWGR